MMENEPLPWRRRPWGAPWKTLVLAVSLGLIAGVALMQTLLIGPIEQKAVASADRAGRAERFVAAYLATNGMTPGQRRATITQLSDVNGDVLDALVSVDPGPGRYVSSAWAHDPDPTTGASEVEVSVVDGSVKIVDQYRYPDPVVVVNGLKIEGFLASR